ncbi:MAG: hypothetical protein LBK25_08760 [Treponema sp.]|nr:hypothetical protein [Treponema sp.]
MEIKIMEYDGTLHNRTVYTSPLKWFGVPVAYSLPALVFSRKDYIVNSRDVRRNCR